MKTFEELGVCPEILKAITELGYEHPMPVQEEVIPLLLNEKPTSSPLHRQVRENGSIRFACHTENRPFGQSTPNTHSQPHPRIVPANSWRPQRLLGAYRRAENSSRIRGIEHRKPNTYTQKGVHIIVATPGRLIDLINRGMVQLDRVHTVIMDEADEMLDMGLPKVSTKYFREFPTNEVCYFSRPPCRPT